MISFTGWQQIQLTTILFEKCVYDHERKVRRVWDSAKCVVSDEILDTTPTLHWKLSGGLRAVFRFATVTASDESFVRRIEDGKTKRHQEDGKMNGDGEKRRSGQFASPFQPLSLSSTANANKPAPGGTAVFCFTGAPPLGSWFLPLRRLRQESRSWHLGAVSRSRPPGGAPCKRL